VDNLPCATKYQHVDTHEVLYEHGYRLGMFMKDSGNVYLNNHLIIKLYYHKESEYVQLILSLLVNFFSFVNQKRFISSCWI